VSRGYSRLSRMIEPKKRIARASQQQYYKIDTQLNMTYTLGAKNHKNQKFFP